jgi:hypothetical protein
MKILLVGEFSGFHNNLKDGLLKLDHEVVLASTGDGYKNFGTDISFKSKVSNKVIKLLDLGYKYADALTKMRNYDVVQIINPYLFSQKFNINSKIISYLLANNKKSSLICAGDDATVWEYWENPNNKPMRYNWIAGQRQDYVVHGAKAPFEKETGLIWEEQLANCVDAIIPIMFEYATPYKKYPHTQGPIPIPINTEKIKYQENCVGNKLVIFHGLNRYHVKGTRYIEEAFKILQKKYPNDLELIIDGNMSYQKYLSVMSKANVVIDQVSSYSLAVNALTALAQGKVVLGGAEPESFAALKYDSCPAINITPNVSHIVSEIEKLIGNKKNITELGEQGRTFVERNHDYIQVAKSYVTIWSNM